MPISPERRLGILALGGTIVTGRSSEGENIPSLSVSDLLARLPTPDSRWNVEILVEQHLPGRALTPQHMCALAARIETATDEGTEAFVVTSGTDTLEELAYGLALQLQPEIPVVLTGAMRQSDEEGSDATANLLAALRVASDPAVRGLGPLVVMHDEVHLARWVMKTHTVRLGAFTSPVLGPIGYLQEGALELKAQPRIPDYVGRPTRLEGRVELVWVASGSDGLLIDAASPVADGLVIAGTGGGHVPPAMVPALERAIDRGIPVVLGSRCVSGAVLHHTYAGVGSEIDLQELGLRRAGDLAPLKARLRLLVALALGKSADEVFPA